MAIVVDPGKCTGCGDCVEVCPGDLMTVDPDTGKSSLRRSRDCWGCMSCVKACPRGALERRLPFLLAGYGAGLRAEVRGDRIRWTCRDPAGRIEEFTIKTREF